MPDGYIIESSGMSYCNQTPFPSREGWGLGTRLAARGSEDMPPTCLKLDALTLLLRSFFDKLICTVLSIEHSTQAMHFTICFGHWLTLYTLKVMAEANNLEPGAALGLVFSDKPVITYTSNPVSIRAVGSFFRVGWPLVTILHAV